MQAGHTREYVYPADGFTTGRIGERSVACLTARLQRDFHAHYELRPVDEHDLAQLATLGTDPTGLIVVSGIPGRGRARWRQASRRAAVPACTWRATRSSGSIRAGGTWAHEEPWTEAHRQLGVRTRAAAALADVYHRAGFVPVIDDIYVSRHRFELLVAATTLRPIRLVVLAPAPAVVLARDGRAGEDRR